MLDRPHAIAARLRAPLIVAGAVFGAWLLVQALLWRSGAYWRLAEPDSNAGAVTHAIATLEQAARPGHRTVLVFGDSRVSEGISGPLAGAQGDLDFINVSVPGSTPRTWYYLLREIDRRGLHYDAVVVGTLYVPTDHVPTAEWPLDAVHQVALVGLADAFSYPAWRVWALPELIAQQDTRALLAAPLARWRSVRKRATYVHDTIHYAGHEERMPALGEPASPVQQAHIDEARWLHEHPVPPAIATENAAYLKHWMERIAARAAQREAPAIAFPLPRGPYRDWLPPRAMPAWTGVTVLPADLFAELEDPAYFFDRLHVNRAGRERMSAVVGEQVRARLGADGR